MTRELTVVKFGSETLVDDQGLNRDRIFDHASRLSALHDEHDLLIVTSGAVAFANHILKNLGKEVEDRRTRAMLGTAGINRVWEEAFAERGILAGQGLLTHYEMQPYSMEGNILKEAIKRARANRIVPVFNYKDFLSRDEDEHDELNRTDRYQDNDRFSRELALNLGAGTLIFATQRAGFEVDGEVRRKIKVADVPDLKRHVFEDKKTRRGTGGMGSKLSNAASTAKKGTRTFICHADADFQKVLSGEEIATEVIQ